MAQPLKFAKCRQCTGCSQWYPITQDHWHRDSCRKDDLSVQCKTCNLARNTAGRPIQGIRGSAGRTVGQDVTQQIVVALYTELVNQNQVLQPYFRLATVVQEQVNRLTEKDDGLQVSEG